MLRSEAVVRVNDALGFRASGHSLESKIISRLQEAQRDLERGKTLPRFLLQEDQTLTLLQGEHTADLPTGFLRPDDDNPLYFVADDSHLPHYLRPYRYYKDALVAVMSDQRPDQPAISTDVPSAYIIRKEVVDFIVFADRDYDLTWNYYKAGMLLTSDVENEWLANASEWLIGEAGLRIAADLRDADALQLFDKLRTMGRAAVFGEELAREDAVGPIAMGANL